MNKFFKKYFFGLFMVVFGVFLIWHFAGAQSSFGLETGAETGLGTRDLKELIVSVVKVILGFLGIAAVLVLIYGGFIWMTANGEAEKVEKGKKIVVQMAIGLAIILSSYLIVSYILGVFHRATGGNNGEEQGGGGGGGGGGNIAFIVQSIEPQGNLQFRNIAAQIAFNKAVNQESLANGGIIVEKMNQDGQFEPVNGTLSIGQNSSRVVFTPEGACPEPNQNFHCFAYDPDNDALNLHRITVLSDQEHSVRSVNNETVSCLGASCVGRFTTGADITDRPLHCYNGLLDEGEGEIRIDCGGDCGACAGNRCSNQENACEPNNNACASNICDNNCVCVANPVITLIDPDNGAAGNLVTINGRYFGQEAGQVFLDQTRAQLPNNEQCANSWHDGQIVIVVPDGLELGNHQIKVITQAGLESNMSDFLLNETVRPGLCLVDPESGIFEDRITLSGLQFGGNEDRRLVVFGDNFLAINPAWDNNRVMAGVPNLQSGDVPVRVSVNNEFSNALRFRVNESHANRVSISYFSPEQGNEGQYITIFGSNFGDYVAGRSLVKFSTDKEGSFAFPNECSVAFWTNGSIVVKVPSVEEVGNIDDGPITVVTATGQTAVSENNFDFNNQAAVSPGICSVSPRSVARGENIEAAGENFNNSSLYLNETLLSDSPNDNNNFSRVMIPDEARSGNITARKDNQSSNPIAIEVNAAAGVQANVASYYQWQFTTCLDCVRPEVIKNLSCAEGQLASPSPLPNSRENFIGSLISASFNTSMDQESFVLNDSVVIKECGEADIPQNCQDINAIGTFDFNNADNNFSYFTLDLNNDLSANTWHQVILGGSLSGLRVFEGDREERIAMGEDFGGGAFGDPYGSGWFFKTKAQNQEECSGNNVAVSPRYRLDNEQSTPVNLNQTVNYTSQLYNSDNCNICPNNYSWNWLSSQPNAASLQADNNDDNPHDNQKLMSAIGLTIETANISATAFNAPNTPSGIAELDIIASDPHVVVQNQCQTNPPASPVPYPNYQEACVNTIPAVKFDQLMDPNTLTEGFTLENRSNGSIVPGAIDLISGSIGNQNGIVGFRFIPRDNLEVNTIYTVIMGDGIRGLNGRTLSGLRIWNFKTRDSNELCAFSDVYVEPGVWRFMRSQEQKDYSAQGQGDDCQILKPINNMQWSWASQDNNIASIAGSNENSANVEAVSEGITFIRAQALGLANQGSNGQAIIDFSGALEDLILQEGLPSGESVCINAQAQASFNIGLNPNSVNENTLKLFNRHGETWQEIGYRRYLALNNSVINILPQGRVLWEQLAGYEVRVYGGEAGVVSAQETLLNQSGCAEAGLSWNENGSYCYWRFSTSDRQCAVQGLEVEPRSASTTVGSFVEYLATPKAQNGDPLSNEVENWQSLRVSVAQTEVISEDGHEARATGLMAGQTDIMASLPDVIGGNNIINGSGHLDVLIEERGPEIADIQPVGENICTNAAMSITFDRILKRETINSQTVRAEYRQVSDEDLTGQGCLREVARLQTPLIKFSKSLLGEVFGDLISNIYQRAMALLSKRAFADVYWCPVLGSWNITDFGEGTIMDFALSDLLPGDSEIRIAVRGGENGVKAINNLTLIADLNEQHEYIHAFNTQNQRCDINFVSVVADQLNNKSKWTFSSSFDNPTDNNPNDVAFDTANDRDKLFTAGAFSAQGTELSPIQNIYEWVWQWASAVQNVAAVGSSEDKTAIIEAQNKNGQSIIIASAIIAGVQGKTISGSGLAIVDLCENRWNPTGENAPAYSFVDGEFDFSLSYCRDFGIAGTEDDLPELDVPQTVAVQGIAPKEDRLLREYLIPVPATGDVIGIRVFTNNSHYSPLEWYKKNLTVQGSPQSLTLDGYQAVKDGRSVYVAASKVMPIIYDILGMNDMSNSALVKIWNAAKGWFNNKTLAADQPNIIDNNRGININIEPNKFGLFLPFSVIGVESGYTDIYLLSYNQNASPITQEIVNRLLDNWRFNANIDNLEINQKIRRDVKRLADFQEISAVLENYQASHNGAYPVLLGGTYLNGISTSKWPSWKQTLSPELGMALSEDPINNFNACVSCERKDNCGFDPNTCWNPAAENGHGTFACDAGSNFYLYRAFKRQNGTADYTLATKMEATTEWHGENAHWALSMDRVLDDRAPVAFGCTEEEFGSFCGDGNVNGDEQCEPGMSRNLCEGNMAYYNPVIAGCDDSCQWVDPFEDGGDYYGLTLAQACGGWCGDTRLNEVRYGYRLPSDEQCDASAPVNADGFGGGTDFSSQYLCSGSCKDTGGWCGDGRLQSNMNEVCDLAAGLNGWDCADPEAVVSCSDDCRRVLCSRGNAYRGRCGNNIIEASEQCDGTNTAAGTICGNDCRISSCALGRGDCDRGNDGYDNYKINGCEIDLTRNDLYCGSCDGNNHICNKQFQTCRNSVCVAFCPNGYMACDNDVYDEDGCEINIKTDNNNCGGCGNVNTGEYICNQNQECHDGVCQNVCGDGRVSRGEDCDGNIFRNNATCNSLGYAGGNLYCALPGQQNACSFNTSGCCENASFRVSFTADNFFQLWVNGQGVFTQLNNEDHPQNLPNGVTSQIIIGNGNWVWQRLYTFSSNLQHGENVIAVYANDSGTLYGLIGKFDCGSAGAGIVTTAGNESRWKCVNQNPGANWMQIDFNDSSWTTPDAVNDNNSWTSAWKQAVPGAQIIWKGDGGTQEQNAQVWCRYKTTY